MHGSKEPRLHTSECREGYEMAIVWESVARLMQYRALRESRAAGEMLMYVQALDWSRKGKRLTKGEYKQALQVLRNCLTLVHGAPSTTHTAIQLSIN